ncbi:MAG: rRNA maturation RNase YbeY [Desulfobacteraceae bacterium]|nr:rRNA maturation RNase YbeY [Desulfobacteraceae bacterium]
MAVLITNQPQHNKIPTAQIRTTAETLLSLLGKAEAELSLLITDDDHIAELNRDYLGRTGPTNVIAFPMGGGDLPDIEPELLGDVVISMDTAAREAADAGYSMEERFTELLVHGTLHLLGYDHETNAQDAAEMAEKSEELLAHLRTGETS